MLKSVLVLAIVAALSAGSAAIDIIAPSGPDMPPGALVQVAPTSVVTVTHAPPPEPVATEPAPPTPAAIVPTPVSEVLAQADAPQSASAPRPRGGTSLPLPDGTSVVWGGCSSDGECHWYNFYWAPTREIVMQANEAPVKVQHELCHAHQHWSINRGAPLVPSNYDLHTWYVTPEGGSFSQAVAGLGWPWDSSAVNTIEDFAWTCAYWYLDPASLLSLSPQRYDWAAANLP
jgi:hypothetical protein